MRLVSRVCSVIALAGVCAALAVAAGATAGSAPAALGTIAFAGPSNSGTSCDSQICTVDGRGAALKRLTTSVLLAKADKPGCGLPSDGGKVHASRCSRPSRGMAPESRSLASVTSRGNCG